MSYRAQVKHNGYMAKISFEVTQYEHFCKALQFYNHEFSFYKYNEEFDTYQAIECNDDVPQWLIEAIYKKAAQEMIEATKEGDDHNTILVGQTHTGESSGWGYIEHQWILLPFFEQASYNSMVMYQEGDWELTEFVFNKDSLEHLAYSTVNMPESEVKEEKPVDSTVGLTKESVLEYLERSA